jgi:hypothetical protein
LLLTNQTREAKVIRLSREKYRSVTDTLMLYTEMEYTFFEELEENYLSLHSNPSSMVYIDGEPRGASPVVITEPEAREYRVRLNAALCRCRYHI